MTAKVYVLMPVHDQVAALTALSLAGMCLHSQLIGRVTVEQSSTLAAMRNHLVERALATDATHLLWIDSDMSFPPDALEQLLAHDKPIVAANAARKRIPTDSAAALEDGSRLEPKSEGLEAVASMGLAFMLIEREVFEEMESPWFVAHPKAAGDQDVYFCENARRAGFKIWIDHALSCEMGHVGRFVYRLEVKG